MEKAINIVRTYNTYNVPNTIKTGKTQDDIIKYLESVFNDPINAKNKLGHTSAQSIINRSLAIMKTDENLKNNFNKIVFSCIRNSVKLIGEMDGGRKRYITSLIVLLLFAFSAMDTDYIHFKSFQQFLYKHLGYDFLSFPCVVKAVEDAQKLFFEYYEI